MSDEPSTIEWIRPSGEPLVTNDEKATIEHAEAQGWRRHEKKRRGRPPKNPEGANE